MTTCSQEGPTKLRCLAVAVVAAALLPLSACGGDPPQIVDYSPQRGSVDVPTTVPIRISFDHDVDRASVESRLHLAPAVAGSVRWLDGRHLVFDHANLLTKTAYDVVLEAGYRDAAGNVYTLRHHWSFITEPPPGFTGSTPASAAIGLDPASVLTLAFTREMDPVSLKSAITLTPTLPFDVQIDPSDRRHALIIPSELLAAQTAYRIDLSVAALDVDGNQLDRDQTIGFTTGAATRLRGWIAFGTATPAGSLDGLWIVNQQGFPRQLFGAGPVHSFSWSPGGTRILVQGDHEAWWQLTPGVGEVPLTFQATWAAALAPGMGYVYIDDSGTLHRQTAAGSDEVVAADVTEATVAPSGLRVAYVLGASGPDQVWAYDVGLRARYQLATDTAPISGVTWSPGSNRIAYLRSDLGTTTLRVRSLVGSAATTTIASGDIGTPAWFPDSIHLVFTEAIATPTVVHKAFVVSSVAPPASLNPSLGLPADPGVDVAIPAPSPDGHQIAFLSGGRVWLMNADGTRPAALTGADPKTFPYSCRTPAWTIA